MNLHLLQIYAIAKYDLFDIPFYIIIRGIRAPYGQFNQNYVRPGSSSSSARLMPHQTEAVLRPRSRGREGCASKNRWNMLNLLELLCEIGRFAQLWFALIYFYSQT